MPGRCITGVWVFRTGDLNHAEGLKDLGLFSTVPDSTVQGKLLPSALQNASNTPKVQAVRNPHAHSCLASPPQRSADLCTYLQLGRDNVPHACSS